MKNKFFLHIIFIALAFIAVWIIVANQKVEVFNKEDLRTLSCGWPFKFAVSDLSYRDPPFPWKMSCLSGEWGDPIEIHWPQFITDILVFYALIVFLWSTHAYVVLSNKKKQ
jgi:hypothetical protein